MLKKSLAVIVEPVAFTGFFILTIYRIVWGGGWLILSGTTFQKVLPECVAWILVGILFLWMANQKKNFKLYINAWGKNWIVLSLILFAIISISWSENSLISLYKVFVLVVCSILTAYIGVTFSNKTLLRKLSYFLILAIGLSYILALFFPAIGLDPEFPHIGDWRGWFTLKNFMGPFMAVGTVVFIYKLIIIDKKLLFRGFSICLFLLSGGLVFLSQSATGIIIMIILNASMILVYAWVKVKQRLHLVHYIVAGALLVVLLILVLFNLNFLFGLLGKDATFTGRLSLWSFLLNSGLSTHLLSGNGFGATWASDQFRLAAQVASGWAITPFTAHNGLLETFLGVGLIGVILLLGIVFLSLYRGIKHVLEEQSFLSFFPLILILFVITANITESYLLELESFTWFLMIYALFSTTPLPLGESREQSPGI